MGGKEEERK